MKERSQAEELIELAQRIRDRQLAVQGDEPNDSRWCAEYKDLGSTKTYKNILAGKLDGYDADRWLVAYRSVWNLIEADLASSRESDPVYEDLTTVTRLRVALVDVMSAKGNDRLVILQGPSGAGKTETLRLMQRRYGKRVLCAEANETWKDAPNAMINALLSLLDEPVHAGSSSSERMTKLIDALSKTRVLLFIDEAHHLGPRQLNLIKTIINRTPGEVVLAAMDTLWNKLEGQAYAECRQLIHNRLSERILLTRPERDDVEKIMKRRLGMNGDLGKAAALVATKAEIKGSLKFVTRVCRRALALSGGETPTLEDVAKAVGAVCQTMGVRS